MYYTYPDFDEAYSGDFEGRLINEVKAEGKMFNFLFCSGHFPQYMFGDSMLVSPVVRPVDSMSRMAAHTIWFPPGTWYDLTVCFFVCRLF